jgi:hypothetical protein
MKTLLIINVALTTLLLAGLALFAGFLLFGKIELRRPSDHGLAKQGEERKFPGAKARLLVVRGL